MLENQSGLSVIQYALGLFMHDKNIKCAKVWSSQGEKGERLRDIE